MNDYDLWFILLNINNKRKINLIKRFKSTREIWYYTVNECNDKQDKFNKKIKWEKDKIEFVKNLIFKNKINIITFMENDYPDILKNYDDSPFALFYKGNLKKLNESINISIVGSRACSPYGVNVTKIILKELKGHNINIISGLAKGIDYYAHLYAVENDMFTCGVLGCGIDVVYPKSNKKLYESILEKDGCIISQFMPGTQPLSYNFPLRNRIISGLSKITIVVEANLKSGSLITASAALDQGKEIIAVPGSIFSKNSLGTNKLIKDGAFPLTSIDDIFDLLSINHYDSKISGDERNMNNLEKKIYNVISDVPIHMDDIIKLTNIDISQIYELLFEMQIKDEIMCLSGNYYVKLNNNI
ncbi:protein Smf [Clostridium pasteurianum DSM 525 = ATCC 6013]|uniref:DNA protecting protein DprA n=1 Tax=Clostridium pasteurianum DSM 525 = ATCC 6013 TaxID=1262449 RepID=A0A0H3J3W4_CLOPA|nr:DNA-processing protein DprA [Clostridium pasteurianum]AJA48124.1 protein Smf [Clostridium pasteurianum DSM 525 = ATCC 6013]AJA52112.1 protein Smf [Clostridium pasteurianum DSM 525 = ATCC 6013]AOZ75391.1 DNA processing protein DprA [Clostridium pasteurianum DSM 525 = ATCC 6013]AOZ79186.1 DNA processing protein DprA [Clostridium pasteurianum]ELP60723.1 DNA uptake protein [Clostridium pasteurianum DSM 525 = ATCC 6013]